MSLERAASFRMPFGKHKGSTVADVAKKDHSWLAWFAANGDEGSAKRAIAYYLEHA